MTQLRLLAAAAAIHHKVLKKSVFFSYDKNKRRLLIWKDELHQLNIKQFESPTGPTVPVDVFELYFDIPLQEKMVAESNQACHGRGVSGGIP